MLALLAAMTVATAPPLEDYVVRPQWTRTPSYKDVRRVQPKDARGWYVTCKSSMICAITTAGTLTACRVASETPAGRGLGEAAIKLAPLFRMKPLEERTRRAVAGRVIRIPVGWYPEDDG